MNPAASLRALRIGSRGSRLALVQSAMVQRRCWRAIRIST